jgi:hypothetical protein
MAFQKGKKKFRRTKPTKKESPQSGYLLNKIAIFTHNHQIFIADRFG